MYSVSESLQIIQHWLIQHVPADYHLAAGASEAEVAGLEERLGASLPADIRQTLRLHNGQRSKTFSLHDGKDICRLLSVAELHTEVAKVEKVIERIIEQGDRVERVMVPLLLRPNGEAWMFEVYSGELTRLDFTDEPGVRYLPGITALLNQYARRLQSGRIHKHPEYGVNLRDVPEIAAQLREKLPDTFGPVADWDVLSSFEAFQQRYFGLKDEENHPPAFTLPDAVAQLYLHLGDGQNQPEPVLIWQGETFRFLSLRQSVETTVFYYGGWMRTDTPPIFPLFEGETCHVLYECQTHELVRIPIGSNYWDLTFVDDDLADLLLECLNNSVIQTKMKNTK